MSSPDVRSSLSAARVSLRTARHYWSSSLAVALGVAAGTAVLTGALVVGDSVRTSLRQLTMDRLGRIDEILVADHFFRPGLADSLESAADVRRHYELFVPAILLPGVTVENQASRSRGRASGVTLVGCDDRFWKLDRQASTRTTPGPDEIVINQRLADELGAAVGDELLIRVATQSGIAADSPLGRKEDRTQTVANLKLVAVIPNEGLGRFSLRASQQQSANAFVATSTLQRTLDQPDKVNTLFVAASGAAGRPVSEAGFATLGQALRPTLADLGLTLKSVSLRYDAEGETRSVAEYLSLATEQMIFPPAADAAVREALRETPAQPVFTYLATRIEKLDDDGQPTGELIPYSTISAVESNAKLGPLLRAAGDGPLTLDRGEVALNRWAAQAVDAEPGDRVRITFFEPETTHGRTEERSADFVLQAIAPLVRPASPFRRRRPARYDQPPSLANDPDLTPEVRGITDQESISSWDAPFPINHRLLTRRDDVYWENYRTTPKAYISLAEGRRLWGSRFGQTTSYRIPLAEVDDSEQFAARLAERLQPQAPAFGLTWLRVKRDGLLASAGTTPFDVLFLGFSMFIIASALMLVSLLFRLGIEQRADQVGLLRAVGWSSRRVRNLQLMEASALAVLGSVAGIVIGVGYAWLMLAGLRTWWLAAIVTPFLRLAVRPSTLFLGAALGLAVSLATIAWTLRGLRRVPLRQLMAGSVEEARLASGRARRWADGTAFALLLLSLVLAGAALTQGSEMQALSFFGAGACVLTSALLGLHSWLKAGGRRESRATRRRSLLWLAGSNLARNPGRSSLTIGLVAAACFLIIAISAFRLAPTAAGTGGFQLVAESDQPVFIDLNDETARQALLGADARQLRGVHCVALRTQAGDDASCRNLYRVGQPRLLGVTPALIDFFEGDQAPPLAWAGSAAQSEAERANPWRLLLAEPGDAGRAGAVPVVLDKNTAMYSLQLYGGIGQEFELDYEEYGTIRFRVVGMLSNTIFQGSLLVSERDLLRLFPRVAGYRYFLFDVPEDRAPQVARLLEQALAEQGLDVTSATRMLRELLAVQNTYLSTFQSLGGLGLLLGTFGLAAVELRNILQRRRELALLRATGFRRRQLSELVLGEHGLLLLAGLGTGIVAAAIAVLPHFVLGGAGVPVATLAVTLGLVALVGLITGLVAVRYTSRIPLLPALRGD
jgi:ABC-type antimicrobial peptide transport system permease subunit